MFRNIVVILTIFIATFFVSWLIDLGGVVELVFLEYKVTSSVAFFALSLIFLYFIFYLIFSLILRINNFKLGLAHFIFDNPKRLEKKLNKEQRVFVDKVAKILKEINNKNFSKAKKIEKDIKSNFYSEDLKAQILAQMDESNEIINKYEPSFK
jgi:hypothetical protein